MPLRIKDNFKASDKLFSVPAEWYNSVARFINTFTVRNGDGTYLSKPVVPSDNDPVALVFPTTGAADPGTPSAPEDPTILGDDGEGAPLAEGADDDALTDDYDPEDADQDGLSLWVLCRERYAHDGTMKWYAYYRKLTWPASLAPVVSAETRVLVDEPVVHEE